MNLSKNIRYFRVHKYKLQRRMAEEFGVTRGVISNWETERREPTLQDIIKMADMVSVDLETFIRGDLELMQRQGNVSNETLNNLESKEAIMLDDVGSREFIEASEELFIRLLDSNLDVSKNGPGMNAYHEAFENGDIEVGINILKLVVRVIAGAKITDPFSPLVFQDKLLLYIEDLEELGIDEGSFYRAFALIYGLMETGKTSDENQDDGLILMYDLANAGNIPAIEYVDYIENAKEKN